MTDTPSSQQGEIRQAGVIADHLPAGFTAAFDGSASPRPSSILSSARGDTPEEGESSLKLQGGDMHRDLFKIEQRARIQRRSYTFSGPIPRDEDDDMTAAEVQEPQGFRREYIRSHQSFMATTPVARNFVEFLDLYGAFAGEDLAESDDDEVAVDEEERRQGNETRPLLGKRQSTRKLPQGDAGTTKTFFTLLKAFIGTGIMFLPKAFNNGGLVFSFATLLTVSIVTMMCFHLLLSCRNKYGGGGYGELGRLISGPKTRGIILCSIILSQLGFVCSAVIFVAENLMSFLLAVSNNQSPLSSRALIAIQAVVLIPFSFIRNISKLGPAALFADIFIMTGLVYIWWYDISTLARDGLHPTVVAFNPKQYTLTIGSAIFTFEGIGLILPIQSSMKDPSVFEWLLGVVMLIITVIFTSVGALCYATFGTDTQIEIINNYPQNSKLVNAVQFLYATAVLVGTPVQLFPAMRIIEGKIFGRRSGQKNNATKWKKNAFRTALVLLCIGVAVGGADDLDRFVSLLGSFACVPLVYIYPPFLHYRGVASTWYHKAGDIALMALGVGCMIYTTSITIATSFL